MNTFLAFCAVVAVWTAQVNADGHSALETPSIPVMKVAVKIENDMFKVEASTRQSFPAGMKPGVPMHNVSILRLGSTKLSEVMGYLTWRNVSNCTMFMPDNEHDLNFTTDIEMLNSSLSGLQNATERANQTMSAMTKDGSELGAFMVLQATVVMKINGHNYCARPEVREDEGMKKIRIVFPKCSDFGRKSLIDTIHERIGIDEDKINVGMYGYDGDCQYADVYFRNTFDDLEKIEGAIKALSSMSGLGRFSASEKCKTNFKQSFITEKALHMCFASHHMQSQQYETPLPTCAGVSSQLAQEYRERIKKYDCMMSQYAKKYGFKSESCMSGRDGDMNSGKVCNCASSEETKVQEYMEILLTEVGAPLYLKELYDKKDEMRRVLMMVVQDPMRITTIAGEIKALEEQQMEYYFKAYFGFCMVAGYGDMAKAKLQYVKERVARGDHEDDIVKSIAREALDHYFDLLERSNAQEQADFKKKMSSLKMRIMMQLRISDSCSTTSERERVWKALANLNETFSEAVEKFNDVVEVDEISNVTRHILKMVHEDPREIAKTIFLALYSPMEMEHDGKLITEVMRFMQVLMEQNMSVIAKLRKRKDTADFNELMVLLAMFMSDEDLKKGCDLKELAEKVKPAVAADFMDGMGNQGRDMAQRYRRRSQDYGSYNSMNMYASQGGYGSRRDYRQRDYHGRDYYGGDYYGRGNSGRYY